MMAKLVIEFFYQFNVSLFSRKREVYSKIETKRGLLYSRIIDKIKEECNLIFLKKRLSFC